MTYKTILLITGIVFLMPLVLIFPILAKTVPDTGQIKCYDNTQEIVCPQPGEPFYGQDGNYYFNSQSYTKLDENGNDLPDDTLWPWAMVRDNVTGLIWEVKNSKDNEQDQRENMKAC